MVLQRQCAAPTIFTGNLQSQPCLCGRSWSSGSRCPRSACRPPLSWYQVTTSLCTGKHHASRSHLSSHCLVCWREESILMLGKLLKTVPPHNVDSTACIVWKYRLEDVVAHQPCCQQTAFPSTPAHLTDVLSCSQPARVIPRKGTLQSSQGHSKDFSAPDEAVLCEPLKSSLLLKSWSTWCFSPWLH